MTPIFNASGRPGWKSMLRPISRDKADTLLLLVACSLVLLPHTLHLPLWISAAAACMLGWRAWIAFRGNRMPPRWLLLPIALFTLPGIYGTYQTFFGRDAGVALLVLLLTFKLLEMRARRDLFVVVCLGFFLMLTNLFYSQSILTAVLMLAGTVAILTTQLSFQYTGVVPPLKQRLKLCGLIVGLATPLTLVLFLLFPRIQGPLWGLPGDAQGGHTGMSDNMSPGNIAKLALSEEVAFRVSFDAAVPARAALYWRGVVLGNYDGRTWSRLRLRNRVPLTVRVEAHSPLLHYRVTLEPSSQRWLYALDLPQSTPQLADYDTSINADLQLQASRQINERVRYDATSVMSYRLQPDEDQLALQDWLDLPPGFNPRTHALAASLQQQSDDKSVLVAAVLRMFRQQPFRYTLEPPPLGRDAVDDFLFDTRAGFCEHYASAFVVLMRAIDIPARVVTGYQGGELNPVDGVLTVRQSDAHAWAEVWLRPRGWVRIDPTAAVAPERIERNGSPATRRPVFGGLIELDLQRQPWLGAIRQRLDALGNGWNQWVLNYTPQRQKSLLEALGFTRTDWSMLTLLMGAASGLVLLVVVLPLLWKRRRVDPVEALYQRLSQRMARFGLARQIHEGPHTYAARACAAESRLPPKKQVALRRFMGLYEQARYGDHGSAQGGSERRRLLRQLKSLLTEST